METVFYKTCRGARYDETARKLYVFARDSVSVMRAWPEPMTWRKTRENPVWMHFRPDLMIPKTEAERRASHPILIDELLPTALQSMHVPPCQSPDAKDELIRHYTFNESDLAIIRQHRGSSNLLRYSGFALPPYLRLAYFPLPSCYNSVG